jgi:hypothetical protein
MVVLLCCGEGGTDYVVLPLLYCLQGQYFAGVAKRLADTK